MRIGFVGCGAIGSCYASYLSRKHEVCVLDTYAPVIEYQKEAYKLYCAMMNRVRDLMVGYIFRIQLPPRRAPQAAPVQQTGEQAEDAGHKIGRNDPCPCGSGKKYKKCCGAKL